MLLSKTSVGSLLSLRGSYGFGCSRMLMLSATHGYYGNMIPPWIRKQLFDNRPCVKDNRGDQLKISETSVDSDPLQLWGKSDFHQSFKGFDLPGLVNKNLLSYFTDAAARQVDDHLTSLQGLVTSLPPVPQDWVLQPGWTCYTQGLTPQKIDHPETSALILDVEVCVKEGFSPVLATAVTPKAWYCWVSPSLFQEVRSQEVIANDLIPLGIKDGEKCVVVGHYVTYDAVRLRDSYYLKNSGLRFFDTMALHISISGITNLQKFWVRKSNSAHVPWAKLASGNSLGHLYHLYCGRFLDKSKRNIFVEGSLQDVKEHFQELTSYCAQDVVATHAVFCKLFPLYLERFPNAVTVAAMLEMSNLFVPTNDQWSSLLLEVKKNTHEVEREIDFLVNQIAGETCELLHKNKYSEDPWMWDQNWSVKNKDSQQKAKNLENITSALEASNNSPSSISLSAYPEWYRKIAVQRSGEATEGHDLSLSFGMNITPKLLRLCWGPYPLHFVRGHGWGMLVPNAETSAETKCCPEKSIPADVMFKLCSLQLGQCSLLQSELSYQDLANLRDNVESANSDVSETKRVGSSENTTEVSLNCGVIFRKLPHSQGIGKNVGSPFSKDLIRNPALCSRDLRGQRILTLLRQKQFWDKYLNKIECLPIVWSDDSLECGGVVPEILVTGDYTRHPKEDVFSALSIEKQELPLCRAMEAPSGWWFLSAVIPDVDVWMASLLSDSIVGSYGGTSLGKKVLKNSYFTSVASLMDISEDQARLLTHGVLFGARRGFIAKMIREIDPSLSKLKALGKADRLLEYLLGTCSSAGALSSLNTWNGGVQSELWSKLALAASKLEVVTPILNSRLSRVLESDTEKFSALAMNWIIQSSSVDFLHLLLTCFRDLAPSARLSLVSSEICVHYLLPEHYMYHAAKSLHVAHLYARAFCASRVGMSDLPLASALLPCVQLSRFLKPTKQDKVIKLDFFEAHQQSELSDCAQKD